VRFVGGAIFLSGMFLMAYNTWRTVRASKPADAAAERPAGLRSPPDETRRLRKTSACWRC
jgi:cbb3-type cytochrome oxidase subunit 1